MQQPATVSQARRTNRLLAALPPEEMEAIRPHLEPVPLMLRTEVHQPNEPITHVWFPHRGVLSMVSDLREGQPVEIATIGSEGMAGVPLLLGVSRMPTRVFAQVPGEAARMRADAFQAALADCPALHRLLLRYTMALLTQVAQSAACNRMHTIEERAARWLLMTHDRVHEASFPLTQEFLGQMLGVRRPTVSLAAGMLAKAGLIHYVRGQITILDRTGLEAAACECYGVIAREFEHLVGAPAYRTGINRSPAGDTGGD